MVFLHWKNYEQHHVLFKKTFEIPFISDKGSSWADKYLLFLIKEVHEQTAAFDYYKYGLPFFCMVQRWHLQKRWYALVIFVASSLVWFFYCCFQKASNILATFLASSKVGFLNTWSNIFLISFGLVCIQKKY